MYRKRALHYMRMHLQRMPVVVLARIGRTWSLYRPLDMVAFNSETSEMPLPSSTGGS